jgi:hypothetical protein
VSHASTSRVRCAECGQYPTLTTTGALRNHSYPWAHPQHGQPCIGSGTQIQPLPGQTSLTIDYPETDEYGRAFTWEANHATGKHVRIYRPEDTDETTPTPRSD